MSNPTSNFGWVMPTSTDLVTDLPADFEVFGQAVDTSLADLKGGTTGQILAKATNADMDFTWVANDVGDITAVTAGTGITGGGTSGAVTVSFDQANFGGGQWAAGKNKIINGDFGIWQRGTSFSNPANGAYTADRFVIGHDGTGATRTISQQTFTPGTAPVAGYEGQYFYRYAVSVAGTSNTYNQITQKIEDVRTLAGNTVTVSFWAKADAARTVTPYMQQYFNGSADVYTNFSGQSVTTSWTRFTATVALPSVSGKTIGAGSWVSIGFSLPAGVVQTIDIWGVQLEATSTASNFQTATGTKQGELAACQRYLPAFTTSASGTIVGGYAYATNNAIYMLPLPVNARVAPTGITLTGTFEAFGLNTAYTATPAFNGGTVTTGTVTVTSGLTITAGQGSRLSTNGAATILFTGCEL
jgi:hypothetical protein